MALHLSTPAREIVLPRVTSLRFETWDGHRGVLPGHTPAIALVHEGPLLISALGEGDEGEDERFLACEEGLATIAPDAVHIATRWATEAPTLEALEAIVARRSSFRRAVEEEARALEKRHETAIQRALASLKRDPFG
ncbi:MAG: hypothetical protein H6711_14080 [Myxococcales bacterium]|nr:hypothetical protein [Myxococcales bacterium]